MPGQPRHFSSARAWNRCSQQAPAGAADEPHSSAIDDGLVGCQVQNWAMPADDTSAISPLTRLLHFWRTFRPSVSPRQSSPTSGLRPPTHRLTDTRRFRSPSRPWRPSRETSEPADSLMILPPTILSPATPKHRTWDVFAHGTFLLGRFCIQQDPSNQSVMSRWDVFGDVFAQRQHSPKKIFPGAERSSQLPLRATCRGILRSCLEES
jgi:hypothetical protein